MKIYVAGKWQEREAIKRLQQELISLGHGITVDWTYHEEADDGYPQEYSIEDIEGVRECDVYVGLFLNKHNYKGALVEMGAALGLCKGVCIIGHAIDSCLFTKHPRVLHFETKLEFLGFVEFYGDGILKMNKGGI